MSLAKCIPYISHPSRGFFFWGEKETSLRPFNSRRNVRRHVTPSPHNKNGSPKRAHFYNVEMSRIEPESELGIHEESTVRSRSFDLKYLSIGATKQ